MSLEKLMSKQPITVDIDERLQIVRDIFDEESFHHLLIVDQGKLVGVLSDRDYLKAVNANLGTPLETNKDLAALNIRVHRIMSRNLVTVTNQASITEVILIFHQQNVSCIPVVDEANIPGGIISWKDVMHALALQTLKKLR